MTTPGSWTIESANAALPRVRALLARAQQHAAAMRDLEAQLDDLRIVWGDAVLSVACPGHAEFADYYERFGTERDALAVVLAQFQSMGVEVKDVEQGLVDFRGRVGTNHAYLCWKDGEDRITAWHPLEGGFAARRRLPPA